MSMKRLALFFLTLIMGLGWAVAQNRTVTGTVTSAEDNEPIIGANIVVVGHTNIGTTTNFDGKFQLSVPSNAKQLQFSFVGMKTQILDVKNVMNVVLTSDAEVMETVVVVGYGSGQKLSTVSGSVARVSSEKVENKPVANVMDALQGQVAGMQVQTTSGDPNATASVQIHGNASLGAGGAPLYIVDGVQTSAGVVMAMNSSDFESVTVLKDASSTSIYGARAANGVIVITTKRGKLNEDGRISINTMYGISTLISDRPMQQLMTGQELIDYQVNHTFGSYSSTTPDAEKKRLDKEQRRIFLDGFAPTAFDGSVEQNKGGDFIGIVPRDHDWLSYFLGKKAPTFQADMSISGGSDNVSYYLSGGYFSQEGITRTLSRYTKVNLRSNIDARVKSWLRVGANVSGGLVQNLSAQGFGRAYVDGGTFGALATPRYYSPFRRDDNGFTNEYANYMRFHRSYPLDDAILYNPEFMDQFRKRDSHSYRLALSGYAQIRPIDGLTLKSQAGVDMTFGRGDMLSYPENPYNNGYGSNSQSYEGSSTLTWTNTAEYKWKMNEDNDFTFLLGQEFVDSKSEGFSAIALGLTNKDFMMLGHGMKGNYLRLPSQFRSAYAYFSLFGRVNYMFKNYMAFDVTLRNDRSSRFGSKHQAATFFSVGGMFDFLRSGVVSDKGLVSTLRLKANYGTQGNSSIPLYASYARTGTISYTDELAFGVTSIGNDDLAWERQGMFSLGIDYGMWNDALTIDLALYNRKTKDMLMNVPLPYSTGYSARWENIGAMTNRGIDLTVNYNFLRTKDWDAFVSATFNYNQERVDKLFSDITNENGYHVGLVQYTVGKPIVFYQASFAGFDPNTGKQMWYKLDENKNVTTETTTEYSDELKHRIDYALVSAPVSGGLQMGVTWKKQLSLTFDWTFALGAHTLNNDRYFLENNVGGSFLMLNRSKKLLNEWRADMNDEQKKAATASVFDESMVFDDRLIENASFLRLKNIQLAYTFPKSIFGTQKIITGAKVYVSARNLLTVTAKDYNGFDPEASASSLTLGDFPNTRQFVGGIQLMF